MQILSYIKDEKDSEKRKLKEKRSREQNIILMTKIKRGEKIPWMFSEKIQVVLKTTLIPFFYTW